MDGHYKSCIKTFSFAPIKFDIFCNREKAKLLDSDGMFRIHEQMDRSQL